MNINEKAAYLKGLYDMVKLDDDKKCDQKTDKIVSALLELVEDMADSITALENECAELREYIEEIDEDLGVVEEDLYLDDEEEDDDEEYDDAFDEDDYDEFVCPACGETICVDASLELSDVVCPACGETLGDIDLCDGDCSSCNKDCDN